MLLHHNSKKLSKVLINGTSLRSPHLLETGWKLKYSLLHVLHINGALSHLLYPPFQVLNHGIWSPLSFVYFNCFYVPEVSVKYITMGKIAVTSQVFR